MVATVPPDYTGKLYLLGEGPGDNEDREGRQFIGKSGEKLRALLREAGFEERDVVYSNTVRCRVPFNGNPTMTQVRCCRPFVVWEIENLQPQVTLGVGQWAGRSLTNDGQATVVKLRGRLL